MRWKKDHEDQLAQLAARPTWAGNLISKSATSDLIEMGLARYDQTAQDPDPTLSHIPGAYVAVPVS